MSKQSFFPYRAASGQLPVRVLVNDQVILPGEPCNLYDGGFNETQLHLSVDILDALLEKVLHPSEQKAPPVEVRVVLQGVEARQRISIRLTGTGKLVQTIPLDHRNWRGIVTLRVYLVRTTTNRDLTTGYARDRGAMLASADPIELRFDQPAAPPVGGLLQTIWEDFRQSRRDWLRHQAGNLFALDIVADPPVLYLNSGLEGTTGTLQGQGTHGRNARVRDLTFGLIAHQVWSSLLMTQFATLTRLMKEADGGSVTLSDLGDWQGAVVRDWAPHLFPSVQNREEAVDLLLQELARGGWEERLLMQHLPAAIQKRHQIGQKYSKAAMEEWA